MKTPSFCRDNEHVWVWVAIAILILSSGIHALSQPAWNDHAAALVSDVRAHQIGDILTVIIEENKSASKNTSTKSSKTSGVDAGLEAFLFSPAASGLLTKKGELPSMKLNSSSNFEGGGNVTSSEKITTKLSVRIIDVLPNRQFLVEGSQKTAFGGENQDVVLRGVVRQADVTTANTVFSYNLADVTIQFSSKGKISDSTKRGWFTKVWDKVNPF
jgi:flagellar L-ring protein precursor FlgH